MPFRVTSSTSQKKPKAKFVCTLFATRFFRQLETSPRPIRQGLSPTPLQKSPVPADPSNRQPHDSRNITSPTSAYQYPQPLRPPHRHPRWLIENHCRTQKYRPLQSATLVIQPSQLITQNLGRGDISEVACAQTPHPNPRARLRPLTPSSLNPPVFLSVLGDLCVSNPLP